MSVFAQEVNQLDAKGLKHGLWRGYHEASKRLRYEGTFEHGKEKGTFKFFDDTKENTVIATREFAPDGSCYTIFYNQRGFKVSEGKVVNKQFEGEWKYYHFDSPELMTVEFYKQGKLEGVRKVYYREGAIAEETTYKNGVKEGGYKKYAENGIVMEEGVYKNDVLDGPYVTRGPDNVVTSKGNFVKGKKEGKWEFFENGKMVTRNMSKYQRKFVKRNPKPEPE